MANRIDPEYIRQQQEEQRRKDEEKRRAEQERRRNEQPKQPKRPETVQSNRVSEWGRRIRNFLGGEFLRRINFRKNMAYILMVLGMVIVWIYFNLLTLSSQKKLELLDKERIKLNDKYIQLMDRREMLQVDEERREELTERYRQMGFVDDSSLVYILRTGGKEVSR
ncbi:MAG: hypothetical protein J6T56_03915 [Bacteroidales bacterium]|nr:hypothetical protein [Bacteroidales bacterium]MBP5395453.1 hypothetical protein [Bacteroidales bacterium]